MNFPVIQPNLFCQPGADIAPVIKASTVPHPVPYQGSKRRLAPLILPFISGNSIKNFIEPFAGSAAMTLAVASKGMASSYQISDSLPPLVELWKMIIESPSELANRYEQIWLANEVGNQDHYNEVRRQFNSDGEPSKLLYLLARCVKNAVRFNSAGEFNQSPDKRRMGTKPERMRKEIEGASRILKGKAIVQTCDYCDALSSAQADDFVYMDPPWEGTSGGKDTRYHQLLNKSILVTQLENLVRRDVRFLLSFDGRLGDKTYGDGLPAELGLTRIEINAGRSSQATLSGRDDVTFESLYLSPSLVKSVQFIEGLTNLSKLPNEIR